jgi:hypothetical protein
MLQANPKKKIIILAPSNDPANVVAHKISQEMQKHLETKDLIVIQAYNIVTKKNYVVAYAKLETLKAKIKANKLKTTNKLQTKKAC